MDFCACLSPAAVRLADPAHNKKKVLETLAGVFAAHSGLDPQTVFACLREREKLGSTALGKGVAVPHCRVAGIAQPLACLLRTATAVDYDAPDGAPVSLFFALLVPEDAADEHLQLLAELARKLDDPVRIRRLSKASDAAQVVAALQKSAHAA